MFKVKDQSEDPDLRIAEGSWWPGEVGRRRTRGVIRLFFRPRRWKMKDYSFFVPRMWKMEGALRPSQKRTPALSLFPSDLRPIIRGRRSKMGNLSIFGPEDQRLKRGGSSIFGSDDRRWGNFFDLRLRRSKMGEVFRSSAPKIEN